MGFSDLWMQVILQCVKTVSYTLLLNGKVAGRISPHRGLRQGHPLSPYLLILCANAFSIAMVKVENEGFIQGIKRRGGGPSISHLLYVDDLLLAFKSSEDSCKFSRSLMDNFGHLSGLKVNNSKSVIVFSPNLESNAKASFCHILNMKIDTQIGRYLGYTQMVFVPTKESLRNSLTKLVRGLVDGRRNAFLKLTGSLFSSLSYKRILYINYLFWIALLGMLKELIECVLGSFGVRMLLGLIKYIFSILIGFGTPGVKAGLLTRTLSL